MTTSPPHRLLKWQRNRIYEAIQKAELDPREFELEDGDVEDRIKHRWSESYFTIGGSPLGYVGSYLVGDWPVSLPYTLYTWDSVIQRVGSWLADVKHDLDTPDLWAELRSEAALLGGASEKDVENTPFTANERKQIAKRLEELAEYASRTHQLSKEQTRVLNAKLDYLALAAGRLGRIDWRNAFVGVILGYVLTVALPPESALDIIKFFLRGVAHFSGLLELSGD